MLTIDLLALVQKFISLMTEKKLTCSTSESCTGGLLSALITSIPKSSKVFYGGFVIYSNNSKILVLEIDKNIIDSHSAVSKEVADTMAWNTLKLSKSDIAIGITGIAGPDGGSLEKPIGTVYITCVSKLYYKTKHCKFYDEPRNSIRSLSIQAALEMLIQLAQMH